MTVMIGIDPHKRSHTAVALNEHDEVLDQLRIDADATQLRRLLKFARRWPERVWAIENTSGLGWLLSRQLLEADQRLRNVPPAPVGPGPQAVRVAARDRCPPRSFHGHRRAARHRAA